jgi:hypothetical protein
MALRDKLRQRAQPMLEPGEGIQSVFLVQTGPNPNLLFLTYLISFFSTYKVVVVTDRAVVVLSASMWRPTFPKAVAERLPRQTQIGPTSGALWSKTGLPGEKTTWVHRRFYKDVQAADAALGPGESPPQLAEG